MLEKINIIDYRFRNEGEDILLVFNVITSEMLFLRGNSKDYVLSLLKNKKYNRKIKYKNIEI